MGIAQLVRALDCGSRGRGFEPHYPPHTGMSPSGKAPDFDSGMRWFESSHPCQTITLTIIAIVRVFDLLRLALLIESAILIFEPFDKNGCWKGNLPETYELMKG